MKEMTTREVQMVCLDILKDVHDFCVKNNIRYSLSGGTLLGAIRHNGFIPWDDDADIQMPRPDFEKFIKTYKSSRGYKLFSRELSDGKDLSIRIARICEMKKTYIDLGANPWTNEKVGVDIDILPMEGAPSDRAEMERHMRKLTMLARLCTYHHFRKAKWSEIWRYKSFKNKVKFVGRKMLGLICIKDYSEKCFSLFRKYDYNSSDYFYASIHYRMGEWQPKTNMSNCTLHKFEDTELFVMSGYKNNLKALYGDCYMEIPPKSRQITHEQIKFYWSR